MRQEYRVIWQREGGKKQYRTFQRYPNLLRYARSLAAASREDLKPLVHLACWRRTVGPWYTHEIKDLSYPAGMIDARDGTAPPVSSG